MSRFYHALKGASFGLPANGDRDALMPPVAPPDPNGATERATSLGPWIEEPEISPPENGRDSFSATAPDTSYGKHTDVTLDQTARLIPHSVDPTVVEHYRRLRTKIIQQHRTKPF